MSDDFVSKDVALSRELLAGWPAPAEMYEVRDLRCEKLSDRVQATATIVNPNEFAWAYGIVFIFYTSEGEQIRNNPISPGFWEPGQAAEESGWVGLPDDFDDPPRCEIEVLHGWSLAVRPDRLRPETYERLGWDPETEQRIDGS